MDVSAFDRKTLHVSEFTLRSLTLSKSPLLDRPNNMNEGARAAMEGQGVWNAVMVGSTLLFCCQLSNSKSPLFLYLSVKMESLELNVTLSEPSGANIVDGGSVELPLGKKIETVISEFTAGMTGSSVTV